MSAFGTICNLPCCEGGADFIDSMVAAIESCLGVQLHPESVRHKVSAQGNYISVTLGPVLVENSDQVPGRKH